ncbi:MAG TPA: hypothetical protein VF384_10540 [Planctomycetota bacterium]
MSSPTPPTNLSWIAGLPLQPNAMEPGFRIELAITSDEGQPFVNIGDSDHFSRVLLARLASPGNTTTWPLAVKLQRDSYPARSAGTAPLFDNQEVEAMWEREKAHLLRLGGVASVRLCTVGPQNGVLPPMAFDRQSKRLFRVVSPTWAPLQTCRDDHKLREAGLEPWSSTTARFLHCAAAPGVFYTWSKQDGQQAHTGVQVRRRHDLYRDLVAAWGKLDEPQRKDVQQRLPDLAAALDDLHDDDVEQRIVPLCYHEAWLLCTEMQDVHFDEYCDLAGGASLAQAVGTHACPSRAVMLEPLGQLLAGEKQWLAAPWTAGDRIETLAADEARLARLAIEAACLKLQAFVQVCRLVATHHKQLAVPHLGLSSDNIMLRLCGSGRALAPLRWCFEATLADVGSSRRHTLHGLGRLEGVGALCLPGVDTVGTYLSPRLDPAVTSFELTTQVTARPLNENGAVTGLRIEMRSARERLDRMQPGDVVRVQPEAALPVTGEQALLASVVSVKRDAVAAECRFDEAKTATLPPKPFAFTAVATFHQRLQTPSDLFALGMLLARALLVHDERDLFAVREVWDRILDKAEMMLGGLGTAAPERITATMRNLIDGERASLGSASVLWLASLRQRAEEPVPASLWRELLLLIAKLLTAHSGFSFAAHHGDVPQSEPDAPLRRVLQHAEELLAALQLELTEATARAQEVADVANELAAEINTAMVTRPGGAR